MQNSNKRVVKSGNLLSVKEIKKFEHRLRGLDNTKMDLLEIYEATDCVYGYKIRCLAVNKK
jgi:hypothetical protein